MNSKGHTPILSLMLAVPDAPKAVEWYQRTLGATGSLDNNHQMPWGVHRQGGFLDPFGHIWFVGDRSPLNLFPAV